MNRPRPKVGLTDEVLAAPPGWVAYGSTLQLAARFGEGAMSRGAAYARAGAVLSVDTGDHGHLLTAVVRGTGAHRYAVVLRADPVTAGRALDWQGLCSCPVHSDCKHVVAVLLTLRGRLADRKPAAVPSWETRLAGVLQPDAAVNNGSALAFRLEPTTARSRAGSRVLLRAVLRNRAGRWVRTGASWRDLERGYGGLELPPVQRQLVGTLLATHRGRPGLYVNPYAEPQVFLDDLGTSAWRLLAEATGSGILLLGGTDATRPVHLVESPATVVLDVRQRGVKRDGELALWVRVPDEPDLPPEAVDLVGDPAHGLFVDAPDRLLLARFEQPLDAATHRLLEQGGLRIPAREMGRFLGRYYPALRQRLTVESGDGSVALPEIAPPQLVLRVDFEGRHQTRLRWSYGYPVGAELVHAPLDGSEVDAVRDPVAEGALLDSLTDFDALPGSRVDDQEGRHLLANVWLSGVETAVFVERTLPTLLARTDLVVQVTGTPATYSEAAEPPLIAVSTRDSADGDWFDLSVTVSVAEQDVPLATLIAALAQGQEQLLLDSGTWFLLDRPELHALRRVIEEARSLTDKESDGLRVTVFHAGLWEELVSLGVVAHQSERWTRTVGGLLGLEQIPEPEPPVMLQAVLRPYQLTGYHWLCLLWDHRLGGILADDMGLGKTLQTLAMAARAHEQGTLGGAAGPLLIVAPTSVVATWASETVKFCPGLRVVTVTETERRHGLPLADRCDGADLVITSYALLRLDEDAYRGLTWSGLVLDEAQFVKNHQSRTYQCARRLPAPFKLAITGTPLENSLMDLWSMLSITAPGLFPSPQRFTEFYRKPIESGESPEQLVALRRRLRPLMLRRTKDQVAPDLPPKIEQILAVTLNPAHRRVYDKHLQRERQRVLGLIDDLQKNRIAILRSLTLLRQLSLDASLVDEQHAGRISSSKIDVLMEQLVEVVEEGHRVLVFSQFTGFLALVRDRLDAEGVGYCYLDGRTRNRPKRIAEFTEGDDPVFLISLKAGGVGLTLTEADYVFVLDPWWNPAAEAQAIDRAHRIGQNKTVMVYRLVATDTIEEKVVALQQRKRDLFDRVVGEDAMTGGALTADDIRGLFD